MSGSWRDAPIVADDTTPSTSGSWRDAPVLQERSSWLGNVARGAGEQALDTLGGIPQALSAVIRENPQVPVTPLQAGQRALHDLGLAEPTANALTSLGNTVSGVDLGYVPRTTFRDVLNSSGPIDAAGNAIGFVAEQGLRSVPQVAAMFVPGGAPAVIAGETGRIATERARNDGRTDATIGDVGIAAPAAALSLADKYVARGALGLGGAGANVASTAGRRIAGHTALGSVTEGAQEGAEYLATNAGTQRGFDLGDFGEAVGGGALAGGPLAGGGRALTEGRAAIQSWRDAPVVQPVTQPASPPPAPEPEPVTRPAAPQDIAMPAPAPEPVPEPPLRPEPPVAPPEPPRAIVPAAPPAPLPAPAARATLPADRRTITASGRELETEFQVVPLASLQAASGDLQPRDRSNRLSSDVQIASIAASLDPQRLIGGPDADRGSPIVGPDNIVESGNGRIAALRRVAETDPLRYSQYVAALEAAGYDVAGVARPVLVRRRITALDDEARRAFVAEANASTTMRMSPVEQAGVDARGLTPAIMSTFDPTPEAGVGAASNVRFVRAFVETLPPSERAALVQSDGALSVEGIRRINAAVLARAYTSDGDAGLASRETLARALENPSDDTRSLTMGLLASAPRWAQMRGDNQIGRQYDTTNDLMAAVALLRQARSTGKRLEDVLSQQDAFSRIEPLTEAWARTFVAPNGRPAGAPRLAETIRRYLDDVEQQPGDDGNLFGEAPADPRSIIEAAYQATWKQAEGPTQTSLFRPAADGLFDEETDPTSDDMQDALDGRNPPAMGGSRRSDVAEPAALQTGNRSMQEMSVTNRQSNFREAFAYAGLDLDKAENLPVVQQVRVLVDATKRRFGFRAVEATDAGVQGRASVDQMLDLHRQLRWLSGTLGIPEAMIGLGDRLAVKFMSPAQLTKTYRVKAWGLYAPGPKDIIIPGRSNSMGHEYGHALDHYLGERFAALPDNLYATNETRRTGLDPAQAVQARFIDLMNSLFFDDAALAARVMRLEAEAARTRDGAPTKAALEAQARLDAIRAGRSKLRNERSGFAKGADARDPSGNYISKPVEMFARAFESYLSRKAEGRTMEALTKPEEAYLADSNRQFADLYPQAAERERIMLAFDELFGALRREEAFGDGKPSGRPDDLDMLDPTRLHRQATVAPAQQPVFQQLRQGMQSLKSNFLRDFRAGLGQQPAGSGAVHPLEAHARARGARYARLGTEYQRAALTFDRIFSSKRAVMKRLEDRQPTPQARLLFRRIRDMLTTDPGTGRLVREGYEDQVYRQVNEYVRRLQSALTKGGLLRMDEATNAKLREVLTQADGEAVSASKEIEAAAADIRRYILNPLAYAMRDAGIDVGMVTQQGYFPRQWELPRIFADAPGFKDKGREAYRVVFDNEVGEPGNVDIDKLVEALRTVRAMDKSAVFRGPNQRVDENPIDVLRPVQQQVQEFEAALKRQRRIERDDRMEPDEKEAALAEIANEIEALLDQIYDPIREAYALGRAEALTNRLIVGDATDFESLGPETGFTKSRSLPPEADRIFADYYRTDVVSVISDYARGAAQRIAYVERFGTDQVSEEHGKIGNKLQNLLEEAGRKGALGDDIRALRDMVEEMTGRARDSLPGSINAVNNVVTTFGMMSLLPRAVWSATFEPFTAWAKTGDAKVLARSVHSFVKQAMGRGDAAAVRELAEAVNVTTNAQFEAILASHLNGMYEGDTKWSTISSNYQRLTFQQQVFNTQRASQVSVGHYWIGKQIEAATSASGFAKSRAQAELRELGIADSEVTGLKKWLDARNGALPTADDIKPDDQQAQLYAAAIYRWVDQMILQPSRSDTTILASRGLLGAPFKLLSFSYAWMRQVPVAAVNRVERDAKLRQDEGEGAVPAYLKSGGREAATFAAFATMLVAGHFMLALIRESLFNRDKFEEEMRRGTEMDWLLETAFTRAGLTGTWDPLVQALRGIRYSRDLSAMAGGPYLGYFLDGIQSILEVPFGRNSSSTNTTEHKAAQAAYQLLVVPSLATLAVGLGAAFSMVPGPVGRAGEIATGLGLMAATSRDASRAAADWVAGERPSRR